MKSKFNNASISFLKYIYFKMVSSPSSTVMTGTTCHRLGIMCPGWQVVLFWELLAMDFEKKAAVTAVGPATPLGFYESFLTQIIECTAHRGLRQL